METVKEKIDRLIESAPREVLGELAEDIEDILVLLAAKKEDDGRRIPWEEVRRDLNIVPSLSTGSAIGGRHIDEGG